MREGGGARNNQLWKDTEGVFGVFVSFVAKFEFFTCMSACFNSNLQVVGYFPIRMGKSACSWCLSLHGRDFGKLSSC